MKKVAIFFCVFLIVSFLAPFVVNGVVRLLGMTESVAMPTTLLITSALTSLVILSLFIGLKWCPVSRDYVRTRPWGTIAWTALLAVGMILPLAWLEEFVPSSWRQDLTGDILARMLKTTEGYFVVCMLAPLMEEVVFRGAIISKIQEWGRGLRRKQTTDAGRMVGNALADGQIEWVAIIISAVLFAIAHLNPAQVPHALVVGVLLGWLYVKTESVVPCFILHWINNSVGYVMVNLFPALPTDAPLIDYFGGNTAAMYQAIGSSFLIALPALYQLVRVRR